MNTEPIVVFQGSLSDVKEVAQLLERQGISPRIENPSCSTSSWGTKLTLAVASEEVAQVKALLDRRWRESLDGDQEKIADIVLDFDAEEMTCPACLTTFPTGPKECPDCGLFIG